MGNSKKDSTVHPETSPPPYETGMPTMIVNAYARASKRRAKKEYNNIVEAIAYLAEIYLSAENKSLILLTPFEGTVTLGKFDNSGKKKLQLKLMSNAVTDYPGSTGDLWLTYATWAKQLDKIDSLESDYSVRASDHSGFKNVHEINNIKDFYYLSAEIQDLRDTKDLLKAQGKKNTKSYEKITKKLKIHESIAKEVETSNFLKVELAKSILQCWQWHPNRKIKYKSISEIPGLINGLIYEMKSQLTLPFLETEQSRAADSLFFVAVCETFRIPAAVKYMRGCLQHLIGNNLTFQKVFGEKSPVCTLALSGGTAITRRIFNGEVQPPEGNGYDELSSASDSDNDDKGKKNSEQLPAKAPKPKKYA